MYAVELLSRKRRSVNAERTSDLRVKIKQSDMHRFTCPNCQRKMTIEKEFLYSESDRNTIIKVMLRKERYRWREASKLLEKDIQKVPHTLMKSTNGGMYRVWDW